MVSETGRAASRHGRLVPPIVVLCVCVACASSTPTETSSSEEATPTLAMETLSPRDVRLGGVLGEAVEAGRRGRLHSFITGADSRPVAIFNEESRALATKLTKRPDGEYHAPGSGWLGEHVGKWMIAASRAAVRSDDEELRQTVQGIADHLLRSQEPNGYIGTYAPPVRFTADIPHPPQTWDIWVHTYVILGLLEAHRQWPDPRYVDAARKAADLIVRHFGPDGTLSLAYYGNHLGLSGTVILDAFVELHQVTGEPRYADFAERVIQQAEDRPGLQIVSRTLAGNDVMDVGDGKIYQLCWNYAGVAKLHAATGNDDYLKAAVRGWRSFYEDHLTLGHSPWGGIGGHGEVVNAKGYFSPHGWVETCNTMAWMQLSRELLRITGEARYADTIERAVYNSLLGAQYPNGEDWCYFIFPNGRRHKAVWRDCCKSSGALALEEIGPLVYGRMGTGVSVNLYGSSEAVVELPKVGPVRVSQETGYPRDGRIELAVDPSEPAEFPLFLRIPNWTQSAEIWLNGGALDREATPGTYLRLDRVWAPGDRLVLTFPMALQVHRRSNTDVHRNRPVQSFDYFALTRGPLVYATGLIDGYKFEDTLRLPDQSPESLFSPAPTPDGSTGPAFQLTLPGREPIVYLPYYEQGGRKDGAWRLTWIGAHWE